MFHKKYKVKTSTAVKGSDRKRIQSLIKSHFPRLSAEDLNSFISSKSELSQVKAMTHSGDVVVIYCFTNNPLFFQVENNIFPTVYMLWRFPCLLPTLTTDASVLEKLCNGADLMAPGVIVNDLTIREFENLQPRDLCAVRLAGNKAPIAVGTASLSEAEISSNDRRGKAVLLAHCFKDSLWLAGDQSHPPLIPENVCDTSVDFVQPEVNDNYLEAPSLQDNEGISIETAVSALSLLTEDSIAQVNTDALNNLETVEYSMDEILEQCFMLSLKVYGKRIQLPILTSTFYRTYVLTCCPSGMSLDIKKTTYKKLSVFLKEMAASGLVEVKELTKGVESVTALNLDHASVVQFCPDAIFKQHLKKQKAEGIAEEAAKQTVQENYKFPEIMDMFVVSAQVKTIFESAKIRKGDALVASKVRDVLRDYVKQNSLLDPSNPRIVLLDPVLSNSLLKSNDARTTMTWEELHEAVLSRMSPAYQITFDDEEPKLKKGHLEPIDITTATRTGNKKVTLVNNLENFGIKPEKLANHVQVAVAASTAVGQTAGGKGAQVLIQGNQLRYLQKLLFDIYKVPKRYVKGLENVSSKKKK